LLLVDTNIVSYFHRGDTRAKRYEPHLIGKQLFVSFMTVAELYKWPVERNWNERKKQALVQFLKNYCDGVAARILDERQRDPAQSVAEGEKTDNRHLLRRAGI